MQRVLVALLSACLPLGVAEAEDAAQGRISGHMFGDYYWVVSADDGDADRPQNRNAFQFRRIYLDYNRTLSEVFDIRARLEANDPGFGSRERMTPYVKHAFLRWKGVLGGDLLLGESDTPTWSLSERVWGYRSIERTVLDLNGIGSSADIGVAWKGAVGALDGFLMVANGPGQRPENDHGKKLYASLSASLGPGLVAEVYGDIDLHPAGRDQLTAKAFLGYTGDGGRWGLEPFVRVNGQASPTGDDVTLTGASAFGSLPVAQAWRAFGRLDVVSDSGRDETDLVAIGGLDWAAGPDVNLMPNLYVRLPDGPDPNVQLRATAYYRF